MQEGSPCLIPAQIVDGINPGNLDALMRLYDPDAAFVYVLEHSALTPPPA